MFPFTLRDPVHCLDLLAKDFITCPNITHIIDDAKEVNNFVLGNRVDNIHLELIRDRDGQLTDSKTGKVLPDMRMNLGHDLLDAAINQRTFISLLPLNPAFIAYHDSRTK